jgi:KTSC domain
MMQMQRVNSSNVAAVGYDEDSQTLQVEFNNGSTYQYFDVPKIVFDDLISAGSVGSYLNAHIRGSFRFSRV